VTDDDYRAEFLAGRTQRRPAWRRLALGAFVCFPWVPTLAWLYAWWPATLSPVVEPPLPYEYVVRCCPARAGATLVCVYDTSVTEAWVLP
jgi:hypothetical protein